MGAFVRGVNPVALDVPVICLVSVPPVGPHSLWLGFILALILWFGLEVAVSVSKYLSSAHGFGWLGFQLSNPSIARLLDQPSHHDSMASDSILSPSSSDMARWLLRVSGLSI